MQLYACPECGHQSTYDPWVQSVHCPRCGYTPPKDLPVRPELSKRAGTYRSFLDQPLLEELLSRGKGTHPRDSSFALPTSELSGVLPCLSAGAGRGPGPGARRPWTAHSQLPSSDMMMPDNLLFPGVDIPPRWLLRRIFPFELSALVSQDPRLLADWPPALYHLDVEEVVEDAYGLMIALARRRADLLLTSEPPDETQVRRSFQVTSATYQLVLLPV